MAMLLHHPDLHGRGVGAQQHGFGIAEVDVHGVPHAPSRMGCRDVERFEVVPVGFDLGALGHVEAHADEHVLETVAGLGDQVEVAAAGGGRSLGEVDALSGVLELEGFGLQLLSAGGDLVDQCFAGRVEGLTHLATLITVELAHGALEPVELGLLAEQLRLDGAEAVEVAGRDDGGLSVALDAFDLVDHQRPRLRDAPDNSDIQTGGPSGALRPAAPAAR
jgi:hypothetical protein